MKETVIFEEAMVTDHIHSKSVKSIAEVDEFNSPFAVEVLWFKERVGEEDSQQVLISLAKRQITYYYNDEVDSLSLSFGDGWQSFGQISVILVMDFNGDTLVGLKLIPCS